MGKFSKRMKSIDIAREIGMAVQTLRSHINYHKIPRGKDGLYSTEAVLKIVKAAAERDNRKLSADGGGTLKQQKTAVEIEILKTKLAQIRGELQPIGEVLNDLREYAGVVNAVQDRWLAEVRALTGDKVLVGEAERLRDVCRKRLRDGIAKLVEKVESLQNTESPS